jgi:hypothetical protein
MLVFDGVTETEVSVLGEIAGVGDPQPATGTKAIGKAREVSLTQKRHPFMLALRRG